MPMKLSMMSRIAGPISTMKSAGRMKIIIGTVMVAGRRPAFSSARSIRSVRCSWLSTLRARARGVPYFSAWIIVLANACTDGPLSPLAMGAAYSFSLAARSLSPFDSHVGTLALFELLVAAVAERLRETATSRLERVESAWAAARSLTDG